MISSGITNRRSIIESSHVYVSLLDFFFFFRRSAIEPSPFTLIDKYKQLLSLTMNYMYVVKIL